MQKEELSCCTINLYKIQVVSTKTTNADLRLLEALYIHKTKSNLNDGLSIDPNIL